MYEYRARILRVVDGDTVLAEIDLGFNTRMTHYVRLFGVNTPEMRGVKASPQGTVAKAFTATWVATSTAGWRIVSKKYDQREKYGRILATVYRDGDDVSLNDALLHAGLAEVDL